MPSVMPGLFAIGRSSLGSLGLVYFLEKVSLQFKRKKKKKTKRKKNKSDKNGLLSIGKNQNESA